MIVVTSHYRIYEFACTFLRAAMPVGDFACCVSKKGLATIDGFTCQALDPWESEEG